MGYQKEDHDAVVVGASLAGSTTAMLLAREGARVLLVDQRPDPDAFKRVCGHFIQASAVGTLRRTGLLDAMEAAGAVRSHTRIRTRYGWVTAPRENKLERSVNLRREKLDPLVRDMAADTPGVELLLGQTARALVEEGGRIAGVELEDRDGTRTTVHAPLWSAPTAATRRSPGWPGSASARPPTRASATACTTR